MSLRLLGTVVLKPRTNASFKSCVLRCCCVNREKTNLSEICCRKYPINIISRNFSCTKSNSSDFIYKSIAESSVNCITRNIFSYVHDATGIPWWCCIILSGVTLKICTLPIRIYQIKLGEKLEIVYSHMSKIKDDVTKAVMKEQEKNMWTEGKARAEFYRQMRREKSKFILRQKCQPYKFFTATLLEAVLWISTAVAWRTMTYGMSYNATSSRHLMSQMMTEGPFWCMNLIVPDPSFVLPVLVLLGHLTNLEIKITQDNLLKRKKNWLFWFTCYFGRFFALLSTIICCTLPASVSLFWVTSVWLNFVREVVLLTPMVRRILNLKHRPYTQKEVLMSFREKFLKWIR